MLRGVVCEIVYVQSCLYLLVSDKSFVSLTSHISLATKTNALFVYSLNRPFELPVSGQ